ncbi:MAG: hypothetical protein HYY78_13245 [Betaproteobacteria bacterium]|nr:hypothetical protein [Betaproteobacteria bacterium]
MNSGRKSPLPARRPGLALFALVLAGCATLGGDVEDAKRSWHGARYEEVVLRWGEPARHATLADGRDNYTWVSEGTSGVFPGSVIVFGGSGGAGVGAVFGLPGMGGGEPQRCERTLTFKDGRVVEQTWLGQTAFCSQFRKE